MPKSPKEIQKSIPDESLPKETDLTNSTFDGTKDGEDYEPTNEENEIICQAFTMLDVVGDGVLERPDLEKLLISWGRLPFDDALEDILSYATTRGSQGTVGMDLEGFKKYITKQLRDTMDEDKLRTAFQAFETTPSSGRINVSELRYNLKNKDMQLTDDELDFLYKEEDYWMLEEKNLFDYEELIKKILDKPECQSKFLQS